MPLAIGTAPRGIASTSGFVPCHCRSACASCGAASVRFRNMIAPCLLTVSPSRASGRRNAQDLTRIDLVREGEHRSVRLEDLHVLVWVAVMRFRNLRKVVAGDDGVVSGFRFAKSLTHFPLLKIQYACYGACPRQRRRCVQNTPAPRPPILPAYAAPEMRPLSRSRRRRAPQALRRRCPHSRYLDDCRPCL